MTYRICLMAAALVLLAAVVTLGTSVQRGRVPQRLEVIPESWRGTWEVTVSYRNRETGALVATDVTTEEICPGEEIVPQPLLKTLECSDAISDSDLSISCSNNAQRVVRRPECATYGNLEFTSQRSGDAWTGSGSWSVVFVGNCTQPNYTEDFTITGRRINTQSTCQSPRSSLVQRFFLHGSLVQLLQNGVMRNERRLL